jgi:hypothetical protein
LQSSSRIVLATTAVALLHSALASRRAKAVAARAFGERNRNTFYRPFYIGQSVLSFGTLLLYMRRLPDTVLWKTGRGTAAVLHSVRLAALLAMAAAVNQVGWRRMLGLEGLQAWSAGQDRVPAEQEAQGPSLESGATIKGPFRYSRHPLNFLGLPILWLTPKMTRNWFTFDVLASAYFILGSWHEERRLRAAYGDRYTEYRNQTAFFLGRKKPASSELPSRTHTRAQVPHSA